MSPRVAVSRRLLEWACERTGHGVDAYAVRFPKLAQWASGNAQPTLKQLEAFASATHTPIGYFFLAEPPDERVPISDFRTIAGQPAARPSPDMLEMIYVCQQQQEWYRNFARSMHEEPLAFVGSARITDDVVTAAEKIRTALGFDVAARAKMATWTDALRHFIEQADSAGIMVMCSGVVLNNTTRKLRPNEFRGFALADDLAPLVFINGADTKAAQMFTLANELVYIWLGQSAVSDAEAGRVPQQDVERWCGRVAARLLAPMAAISGSDALSAGGEHISRRFAHALVVSTWEGRSSFTEAFRLLGVTRMREFRAMSSGLGILSEAAA